MDGGEPCLPWAANTRVVPPVSGEGGWAREWPCRNGFAPGHLPVKADSEKFLREYNQRIVASSDEFYSYISPSDFRLERREVQVFSTREVPDPELEAKVRGTHAHFLRFTSPVDTPYPENNTANPRWFPAPGTRARVAPPPRGSLASGDAFMSGWMSTLWTCCARRASSAVK